MDPVLAAGLVELAKVGLQGFFLSMRLSGKTPQEIEAIYQAERSAFYAKDPGTLPEVK